jgi:hypothetical protein
LVCVEFGVSFFPVIVVNQCSLSIELISLGSGYESECYKRDRWDLVAKLRIKGICFYQKQKIRSAFFIGRVFFSSITITLEPLRQLDQVDRGKSVKFPSLFVQSS